MYIEIKGQQLEVGRWSHFLISDYRIGSFASGMTTQGYLWISDIRITDVGAEIDFITLSDK